jgi:hypothetical protein
MKKLYYLDEQEKQRILNLHTESTKRQYLPQKEVLNEQDPWSMVKRTVKRIFTPGGKNISKITDDMKSVISGWDSNLSKKLQSLSEKAQEMTVRKLKALKTANAYDSVSEKLQVMNIKKRRGADDIESATYKESITNPQTGQVEEVDKKFVQKNGNGSWTVLRPAGIRFNGVGYQKNDIVPFDKIYFEENGDIPMDQLIDSMINSETSADSWFNNFFARKEIQGNSEEVEGILKDMKSEYSSLKTAKDINNPGYIAKTTGIKTKKGRRIIRVLSIGAPIIYAAIKMFGFFPWFIKADKKNEGIKLMKTRCNTKVGEYKLDTDVNCGPYEPWVKKIEEAANYDAGTGLYSMEGTHEQLMADVVKAMKNWDNFCKLSWCLGRPKDKKGMGKSLHSIIDDELENPNDYKTYFACTIAEYELKEGTFDKDYTEGDFTTFEEQLKSKFETLKSNNKDNSFLKTYTYDMFKKELDNKEAKRMIAAWYHAFYSNIDKQSKFGSFFGVIKYDGKDKLIYVLYGPKNSYSIVDGNFYRITYTNDGKSFKIDTFEKIKPSNTFNIYSNLKNCGVNDPENFI